MSRGPNLPAIRCVNLGPTITECFSVARRNKWRGRAPDFRGAEQLTARECLRLAETNENQTQVMAAVSPNFVKTAKSQASLLIEALHRPNRQVCDCITRTV